MGMLSISDIHLVSPPCMLCCLLFYMTSALLQDVGSLTLNNSLYTLVSTSDFCPCPSWPVSEQIVPDPALGLHSLPSHSSLHLL